MKSLKIVVILMFALYGCIGHDFELDKLTSDVEMNPGINLALANAKVSIGEIFNSMEDATVTYYKDKDGNERIKYIESSDALHQIGIDDLFIIDAESTSLPFNPFVFNAQPNFEASYSIPFSIEGTHLSELGLSYDLNISYENIAEPVELDIEFTSANQNDGGRTFHATLNGTAQQTFSIDNDNFTFMDSEIPVSINITPVNTGFHPNQTGNITFTLSNFRVEYLKGTMNQITVDLDDMSYDLNFDFLDNIQSQIYFDNPMIHMFFINEWPFGGIISSDIMSHSKDGSTNALILGDIQFNGSKSITEPAIDTVTFDKYNSNFRDIISFAPQSFDYGGTLILNPGGVNNQEMEVIRGQELKAGYEVEIPLEFRMDTYISTDTFDLDVADILDDAEKAKLSISSVNGFPFGGKVDILFYNSDDDKVLDAISTDLISAAEVNSEGIVVNPSSSTFEIELTDSQINNLSNSDQLLLNIRLTTSDFENDQIVVLLTNYSLEAKISLKTQLNLSSN